MAKKLSNGTAVTISSSLLRQGKKHLFLPWTATPATVDAKINGSTDWEGGGYRYSLEISPGRSIFWISPDDFKLKD